MTRISHLLRAATLTAEMLSRRDRVRDLLGPKYADATAAARRVIEAVAARDGIGHLQAALKICEQAARDGHGGAVNTVIAAAVDMCEECES